MPTPVRSLRVWWGVKDGYSSNYLQEPIRETTKLLWDQVSVPHNYQRRDYPSLWEVGGPLCRRLRQLDVSISCYTKTACFPSISTTCAAASPVKGEISSGEGTLSVPKMQTAAGSITLKKMDRWQIRTWRDVQHHQPFKSTRYHHTADRMATINTTAKTLVCLWGNWVPHTGLAIKWKGAATRNDTTTS